MIMLNSEKDQWEQIYSLKNEHELSWFQQYPNTSMELIKLFKLPVTANIIDIGGGDSHFVDALVEKGYQNIWVLDISEKAIEKARERLGDKASKVHWIVSDITEFIPKVKFDVWHDRAAFHFLTSEERISKYVAIAEHSLKKGGKLILGTFSKNGPSRCSGFVIHQYSDNSLSERFKNGFKRIKCFEENHLTPFNTIQNFLFCSFKKR